MLDVLNTRQYISNSVCLGQPVHTHVRTAAAAAGGGDGAAATSLLPSAGPPIRTSPYLATSLTTSRCTEG